MLMSPMNMNLKSNLQAMKLQLQLNHHVSQPVFHLLLHTFTVEALELPTLYLKINASLMYDFYV